MLYYFVGSIALNNMCDLLLKPKKIQVFKGIILIQILLKDQILALLMKIYLLCLTIDQLRISRTIINNSILYNALFNLKCFTLNLKTLLDHILS